MVCTLLKIDLDIRPVVFKHFKQQWIESRITILARYGLEVESIRFEKSSSGFLHILIGIDSKHKLLPTTVNMLQLLCGDHAYRVMLNQRRIDAGITHWNKLFFKKYKLKKV